MSDGSEPTDEEHRKLAEEMLERWRAGEPKSQLELEYWGDATSHGKHFSGYVKRWTGTATEGRSAQSARIDRLENLLRVNGISPADDADLPEEFRLVAKARESALAAVRVHNDPVAGFRTETFIVLMVIAWNALLQAICERDDIGYLELDDDDEPVVLDGRPKVVETWELIKLVLGGAKYQGVRANLDFFLRLRNQIAHRYIPVLDMTVIGEAQAMLLNFEEALGREFGEAATLGDQLSIPLQLSRFRSAEAKKSLRKVQAQLPTDVANFLARHREEVSDEVLASSDYCMQIFFVPVTANRERSADAVVNFVPPDKVSDDLAQALRSTDVVTKRRQTPVASGDLLRPAEVVEQVAARLPYRFTMDTHTRCWKHFKVRPVNQSGEPEATAGDFCRYDRLSRGYGYTKVWVERLVAELSDADTYEETVGVRPAKT